MKEEGIVKKMYCNKIKWQKTCLRYVKLCEHRKIFVISIDKNIQLRYKIINHNSSSLNWSYNAWKKYINAKVQEIRIWYSYRRDIKIV